MQHEACNIILVTLRRKIPKNPHSNLNLNLHIPEQNADCGNTHPKHQPNLAWALIWANIAACTLTPLVHSPWPQDYCGDARMHTSAPSCSYQPTTPTHNVTTTAIPNQPHKRGHGATNLDQQHHDEAACSLPLATSLLRR